MAMDSGLQGSGMMSPAPKCVPASMILRRISEIRRALVAAPGYLKASSLPLHPDDLAQHRCLIHSSQPGWVLVGKEPARLRPPAVLSSDSMGFLLQSAILGAGIALLPAYVCHPALDSGALVALLPDWVPQPYEMTMIYPSRENPSRAQLAFRDHVGRYDFSGFR